MDSRMQGLTVQLALHSKLFLNSLDGVDDEAASVRPGGTNNMAFLAAHLVESRHWIAGLVGLTATNPFADRLAGAKSIDDVKDCPSVAEARDAWRALAEPLEAKFATVDASVLDRPSPYGLPVPDKSVFGTLAFLIHHEAYHIGQIALLRRYTGSPAMSYR